MQTFAVLIVDDEEVLKQALARTLPDASPHDYLFAGDGEEAMAIVKNRPVNLVVTDLQMPKMNGEQLLAELRAFNPEIPVIIMTSFGTISNAVSLLQKGAYDYVTKPFKIEELTGRIDRALEKLALIDEIRDLRQKLKWNDAPGNIIGRSARILAFLKKLPSIARSDASVIILGESGTGKELVAKAIHSLSPRVHRPFVAVDCGALPETLLENELFGHVRGAFTDAHRNQAGLIQEADQGTLFLDEIGEIGLPVQVKLLRFLQEKVYKPLGSTRSQKVDVRVLSATNRDLRKAVGDGSFREDLFYRLNIIPITLPPLRDRKEDIPLLANHFLEKSCREFRKELMQVSPVAMQKLVAYDWPGNIRELENKMQQLVALSETNTILAEDLELDERVPMVSAGDLRPLKDAKAEVVNRFEIQYIERVLAANGGNVTRAALQAGKHRRAFWELMKKHGISASRFQ